MKRAPNPRTYMLMAVGTLVVGAGASYFGYSQMTAVQAEVAQVRDKVQDEKAVQKKLDESKLKLDECAAKLEHLEAGVPDFAYVPTLMTELEKAGKQYGIQILGVRPIEKPLTTQKTETKKKEAYDELAIEVKGFGSYGSIMRFVNSLRQFPKVVAARSIQLAPKSEMGQKHMNLDMVLELRAYVFADEQTDKAKASALKAKTASLGAKRNEG